jgi:hypothetical protein
MYVGVSLTLKSGQSDTASDRQPHIHCGHWNLNCPHQEKFMPLLYGTTSLTTIQTNQSEWVYQTNYLGNTYNLIQIGVHADRAMGKKTIATYVG